MENTENKSEPNQEGNQGPGRPSKYGSISLYQVEVLSRLGLTDPQMAEALGICDRTFNRYKKQREFWQALKRGKRISDGEVERALFHRAIGYSHPETIIMQYRGKVIREEVMKHYPPDTAAAFIWLKNRQPKKWRDKQEISGDFKTESKINLSNATPEQIAVIRQLAYGKRANADADIEG